MTIFSSFCFRISLFAVSFFFFDLILANVASNCVFYWRRRENCLEINWFRQFYSPCAYFGCEIHQRQTLDEAEVKLQFANDFLLKRNQKERSGSRSARSALFFACVARKIFRLRFFRPRRLRTRPRSSRSSRKIFAARKNFSRAKIFARKFRNFSQLAEPLLAQLSSQLFRAKIPNLQKVVKIRIFLNPLAIQNSLNCLNCQTIPKIATASADIKLFSPVLPMAIIPQQKTQIKYFFAMF